MLGLKTNREILGVTAEKMNSKVRRCLFGRPDHKSLRESLKKEISAFEQKDANDAVRKWNFDVVAGKPLEGRYKWEVIEDSENIPEMYRKGYPTKVKIFREFRNLNVNNQTDTVTTSEPQRDNVDPVQRALDFSEEVQSQLNSESSQNVCNTTELSSSDSNSSNSSLNLVQTQITDYCRKRKRPVSPDYSVSRKSPKL